MRRMLLVTVLAGGALVVGAPGPAGAGGGGCSEPITSRTSQRVAMKDFCFTPTVVHLDEGDSVTWVNRDFSRHNVAAAGSVWGTNPLRRGDSVTVRFLEEGTYPYYCQFHYGMLGAVVVGDGLAPPIGFEDKSVEVGKVVRAPKRAERPGDGAQADAAEGAQADEGGDEMQADPAAAEGPSPAPADDSSLQWVVLAVLAAGVVAIVIVPALRRRSRSS